MIARGVFHCRYTLEGVPANAKRISMIAGGTGITPMYQVIKAVLKQADDETQLALLYANQSPDDILLFEELQEMARDPRLKIWYTGKWLCFSRNFTISGPSCSERRPCNHSPDLHSTQWHCGDLASVQVMLGQSLPLLQFVFFR